MNKSSQIVFIGCILLLLSSCQCLTYQKIETLGDVLGSGDTYPSKLPIPSSKTALKDVKVLFAFSHGVEDQEVYYFYNYLIDRGTTKITLGIDYNGLETDVILSDFYKPSYSVPKQLTADINSVNFEDYDIVYIPGGFPSSFALRNNKLFIQKLRQFYFNPKNSEKLVVFMCSGTELFIQSGIINDYLGQNITGSPAAINTFHTYLKAHNIPLDTFTSEPAINFKLQNKPRVILARDPNASIEFVTMVSNVQFNLNESFPTDTSFVPLRTKEGYPEGKAFIPGVFELIPENTPLKNLPDNHSFKNIFLQESYLRSLKQKNSSVQKSNITLLAVSSGVAQQEINQLIKQFNLQENQIYTICPSWVKEYKSSQVFTFSQSNIRPIKKIICDYSFDDVKSLTFDSLIVPGGQFSTNAVLRNDDSFISLLNDLILGGKQDIVLSSSALGLLLPLKLNFPQTVSQIYEVPTDKDVKVDTKLAGFENVQNKKIIHYNKITLQVSQ